MKIGSRCLYESLERSKAMCEAVSKDSHPNLSEEEIEQKNEQRIQLDYTFVQPYQFATFSQFSTYVKYFQLKVSRVQLTPKKPVTQLILGDNLTDTSDTSLVDLGV